MVMPDHPVHRGVIGDRREVELHVAALLADRAGVGRTTVLRLEAGDGANLGTVLRVARALGVLEQLVASLDPYESDVGRLRADEALPERVRHTKGLGA